MLIIAAPRSASTSFLFTLCDILQLPGRQWIAEEDFFIENRVDDFCYLPHGDMVTIPDHKITEFVISTRLFLSSICCQLIVIKI